MSYTKRILEENQYNQEVVDFLKKLLEEERLYGAIEGITKQILNKGIESLTGNQRPSIDSFIKDYISEITCEMCSNGNVSELKDYLFIEEEGLCPQCNYNKENYMRD